MRKTIELLKALADGTRLQILMLLSQREMAVCELIDALQLSQPAVSHHLKILKHVHLVKDNREGKWIFYSIDKKNFTVHTKQLMDLLTSIQENLHRGVAPSPIRSEPCICEKLKAKNRIYHKK